MIGLSHNSKGELMTGFKSIISQLEQQRAAIDKALAALREVEGESAVSVPAATASPTANNRRSEAQKARWAKKKRAAKKAAPAKPAPVEAAIATTPAKAARKGGMTEEGRKRLADAMKKRRAVKRAGSAVKKGRKKAA